MTLEPRAIFDELRPGDRIEVTHEVKVGRQRWATAARGSILSIERRRHGLHYRRNGDDKVFSDLIVLDRGDGEKTTVSVDEFTSIRKL